MTLDCTKLLGRSYVEGSDDCYGIVRAAYLEFYGIELKDYARPTSWWENGLNLYMDNFYAEGFRVIDEPIHKIQDGDLLLVAVHSEVANHAGVFVGGPKPILHHAIGRVSELHPFSGIFRNTICAHLRHKDVHNLVTDLPQMSLLDLLPESKRVQMQALIDQGKVQV
jgi:cell wall-associated NlpC family hydrolase